jgi:hemerythrin-like metal-binding protein
MSAFLEWTNKLILGVPVIDEQHLGMLTVLNRLAEVLQLKLSDCDCPIPSPMPTGSSGKAVAAPPTLDPCITHLLEEFAQLAHDHMKSEEALMSQHGYPGLVEHKREHTMLSAELNLFVRDIIQGTDSLDQKALCALKQWLIVHIVESDKAFVDYLNAPGDQP